MITQYWQVLNLDRRETLGQDSWGEMHDILQSAAPDGLIYQLIATDTRNPKSGEDIALVNSAKRTTSLDNPNDHPNNAPSSSPSDNTNPGNNAASPGTWSTDRIVIISDYALAYPEGMLTTSEMDEIEDMYLDDSEDEEYEEGDPAPTLYSFAEEWYGAVPARFLKHEDVASGVVGPRAGGNKGEEQGRTVEEAKGQEERAQEPQQPILHLRNLSKKEYVRSDVIARVCPERIVNQATEAGLNVVAPGLGHALVVLACWTSEVEIFGGEERGEMEEVAIGKGVWAGDRVEVKVVKKEADKEDSKEEWKDVSEQVAKVLDAVWKSLAF